MMNIVTTIKEVREAVRAWKAAGKTVGLVPTMGFLHEGHASLIKRSSEENDYTVVSVFVNPTQFGPTEDLETYPRDPKRDHALCEAMGATLVFRPDPSEMYVNPKISVQVADLHEHLCGLTRPVHFHGVCTVVSKLFNIVTPDRAYFGQKDAQQLAIIRKMVEDLNFPIEIVGCPIIREEDGLAKSSRNTYLNAHERKAALCLSRSIFFGEAFLKEKEAKGDELKAEELIMAMREILQKEALANIEYVSVVDAFSMKDVKNIDSPVLVAMAVRIGNTRLIDNFSFTPKASVVSKTNAMSKGE